MNLFDTIFTMHEIMRGFNRLTVAFGIGLLASEPKMKCLNTKNSTEYKLVESLLRVVRANLSSSHMANL